MLQDSIIRWSPRALRFYRTRLNLDFPRLLSYVPQRGRVLDVGCGVGSVDVAIALRRPELSVLGIDLNDDGIALANRYNRMPNVEYRRERLDDVDDTFDAVLFLDVFHHVHPSEHVDMLVAAAERLTPGGYVLVKDIERARGQVSLWMDRYVSRCPEVYLHNLDEMEAVVDKELSIESSEVKFRFPFPHYYIKAAPRSRSEA
jgi:2-polyprenyl-3-methyl-5-hydroxy-6-metoxy-1,4-benzoquinol methylase